MAAIEFKLTTNQLSTEIEMGLNVTSVSDPNRVVITSPSGYLVASDVTYNQLLALIEGGGGGGIVSADNGLTLTSGNVQLGGDLINETLLSCDTTDYISFNIDTRNSSSNTTGGLYIDNGGESILYFENTSSLESSDLILNNSVTILRRIASGLQTNLQFDNTGNTFSDARLLKGLAYGGNYSSANTAITYNPRWIPDIGFTNGVVQNPSNPTATDIPVNTTRQWKNTTSGELRQWSNDNGVLKSVLLS